MDGFANQVVPLTILACVVSRLFEVRLKGLVVVGVLVLLAGSLSLPLVFLNIVVFEGRYYN